ncbi:MAG TPA: hypothetical protein VEB40_03200, partial [Flavipsychrobacter sp.]|nr:hypothetical protein [Flavipsychrobacter sp.]
FFKRFRGFANRSYEWLTIGTFIVFALMISFSGFKLPHYLPIIFPATAVLTASYLFEQREKGRSLKGLLITQVIICVLCLLIAGAINIWAFPVHQPVVIFGFLFLLGFSISFLLRLKSNLQKLTGASVITSLLVFFLLNANFYPLLLQYQGGNELAVTTKEKVDAKKVWFWPGIYSSSYNYYTSELRKEFTDTVLQQPSPVWIITDSRRLEEIKLKGLPVLEQHEAADYEITTMQLPFVNPATRKKELSSLLLVRVK